MCCEGVCVRLCVCACEIVNGGYAYGGCVCDCVGGECMCMCGVCVYDYM